jgi:hypothetical protein
MTQTAPPELDSLIDPTIHVSFAKYDLTTGRIAQFITVPLVMLDHQVPDSGFGLVVGPGSDVTDYVDLTAPAGPTITPRPGLPSFDKTQIMANGVDEAHLTGLPPGCVITVDGIAQSETPDGHLTVSLDHAATFHIHIDPPWPYLAGDFVIEAAQGAEAAG